MKYTLKELKKSTNKAVLNGFKVDLITKETMQELGLKCFKTCYYKNKDFNKNQVRKHDRLKAIELYGYEVVKNYNVHHLYNGLVGLCEKKSHVKLNHYGGLWRQGL